MYILPNLKAIVDRLNKADEIERTKPLEPIAMQQGRMGKLKVWAKPDVLDKEGERTPPQKIAFEKEQQIVTGKAEIKATHCWRSDLNCKHNPMVWVREVQFDIKNEKAGIDQHIVSSSDYDGPVPGLCLAHIGDAPLLAQAVYFNRAEMYWGLKPQRWFVIFTDGTKTGGSCLQLDPQQVQPEYVEGH